MSTESITRLVKHRAIPVITLISLAVLCGIFLYTLTVSNSVSTEDAYVQGNIVQVTSQIAGTIVDIGADDTQTVKAGATLVKLNPVDYEVQLERAKAALASAVRQARIQFHQVDQLNAEVSLRENDLNKATSDLTRRQQIAGTGAVSGEEVQHAADVVANARAALEATRQQLAQRMALTDGLSLVNHPEVMTAATRLKDAYIALHRTAIPAPVDGTVSKRSAQVGQRIAAGASMMSVVPLEQLWVDANFKESQLEHIRVGQPVTLTTDIYGSRVALHGIVKGLDAGTGSAFSLLPAQNATGNWIKVTQRLPVRIEVRANELKNRPLRLGLSMKVTVDTSDRTGQPPSATRSSGDGYKTQVFDNELRDAQNLVGTIIKTNAGPSRSSGIERSRAHS